MTSPTARNTKAALPYVPCGTSITDVERMSRAFTKFHLSDGRALHRFSAAESHMDPHCHPWSFTSDVLAGGYVEEVFNFDASGWRSALINRAPGTTHHVPAAHIHRIVELPMGVCWTLVKAGPAEREVRFWRFSDRIVSRAWHSRSWIEVIVRP